LPKFVKKYGDVWGEALRAIEAYGKEVKEGSYPAPEHGYAVKEEEVKKFEDMLTGSHV
jgi:3-methyl-2-oxobutanoate hydroxymethyltransferase